MSNETRDDFITFKGKVYAVSEGEGRLVMTEVPTLKSGDTVTDPRAQLRDGMRVLVPVVVGRVDLDDSHSTFRLDFRDEECLWVEDSALRGAIIQ